MSTSATRCRHSIPRRGPYFLKVVVVAVDGERMGFAQEVLGRLLPRSLRSRITLVMLLSFTSLAALISVYVDVRRSGRFGGEVHRGSSITMPAQQR